MKTITKEERMDLLFQATGSMKLVKVWMERVIRQTAKTWDEDLDLELTRLQNVIHEAKQNLQKLIDIDVQTSAMESFYEKMEDLTISIETKNMELIQGICHMIQNQLDYIVNDLDKKRKRLYGVE